jgi:hypothetical protein
MTGVLIHSKKSLTITLPEAMAWKMKTSNITGFILDDRKKAALLAFARTSPRLC